MDRSFPRPSPLRRLLPLLALGWLLAACAGPGFGPGHGGYGQAVPNRPIYKVGAPYQINGVWYTPRVNYFYDKTGTASWYGEAFEGRYTANGETFDLNQLTAAHRTLPMPSIVEVTNLGNGRSLRLRVNDRGPFADGRIIDVSRRAAQLLGFETAGTAPVRIRILPQESIAAAEQVIRSAGQNPSVLYEASAAAGQPLTPPPEGQQPPGQQQVAQRQVAQRQVAQRQVAQQPAAPPPVAQPPMVQEAAGAPVVQEPPPVQEAPVQAPMRQPAWRPPPVREAVAREPVLRQAPAPEAGGPIFHVLRVAEHPPRRLFIEAASFARPDAAIRVGARVAPLGNVAIVTTSDRGAPVYVVRLGPVASGREAMDLLARLLGSGYAGARIVDN